MTNIIKPLTTEFLDLPYTDQSWRSSIFLAGTIDNGNSVDWQAEAIEKLTDHFNWIVSPRKDDWNPNASKEEIKKQIQWELAHIDNCSVVLFNFLEDSVSPITLLELGLVLPAEREIIVVCPEKYWRSLNVYTTCEMYEVYPVETLDKGIKQAIDKNKFRLYHGKQ